MKTLYLDCSMGASGDMLAGALWELVEDKEKILAQIETMGLEGVSAKFVKCKKCAINGTKMNVLVNGQQEHSNTVDPIKNIGDFVRSINLEDTLKNIGKTVDDIIGGLNTERKSTSYHEQSHEDHNHEDHIHEEHNHGEQYNHEHNSYMHIKDKIAELALSDRVKRDVLAVYALIAEAEADVHGGDIEHIHFHELGTLDAIADIAIVAMLIEAINPDNILASPVNVGGGFVKCAHGVVPVPTPATVKLLKGIPVFSGKIKSELCTPTGAALLKHFVKKFADMSCMTVESIGYGFGEKDFEIANCIRAVLGNESVEKSKEKICEFACNIDDMSAERIGFAMDMLMESGALDVYTQPIAMKKNRPATMLTALCLEQNKQAIVEAMFKHTSTLGVRERELYRHVLNREVTEIDSQYGKIHKKTAEGYGVSRSKYEYEDLARIARENNLSIEDVEQSLK